MMSKSLLVPTGMVLAALVVALVMLFVVGTPEEAPRPPTEDASISAAAQRELAPLPDGGGFVGGGVSPGRPAARPAGDVADADFDETMDLPMEPWEAAINEILESDVENQQVATQLMALLPTLPSDGQVEAMQHMVNLTDDENYHDATAMLLNPATSEDVAEVIYSDVLNRPNNVKLPVMVSILRTPGHRLRDETLSTLQIFLGEDLGNNAEAWNLAVQNYLTREAQEEAEMDWDESAP
jgi:hypothetical protein